MANLFRVDEFVKTVLGPAIPGAQLFWCNQPTNIATYPPTPVAVAFSDPGGLVPLTFPVLTDGFGHGDVYLNPGLYTLVVAFGGKISQVYMDQSVGGVGTGSGIGTALALQVNGTPNVNQLLLNLQGQNSVSVSDAGNGTVNIVGSVFQTNGVPNTLQSVHNLIAGANVTLTSDAFGGTTIAASSASFSGSASFMFGPGIRDLGTVFTSGGWQAPSATNVNNTNTANRVVVYLFQLDVAITVSKASISCTNNTIGPVASFGIYSFTGNKLLDTGTFTCLTSPAVQTNTISPSVTLPPGTYWHAQTSNTAGGGDTFTGIVLQSAAGTRAMPLYIKNTTRCGTAANPSVAGVLPATLGAITAFTPISADGDGFNTPLYE
jgi:hypothetical protein